MHESHKQQEVNLESEFRQSDSKVHVLNDETGPLPPGGKIWGSATHGYRQHLVSRLGGLLLFSFPELVPDPSLPTGHHHSEYFSATILNVAFLFSLTT